eukprot:scaffold679688_cov65-Prasinocladus_malaysianus.AAC.1
MSKPRSDCIMSCTKLHAGSLVWMEAVFRYKDSETEQYPICSLSDNNCASYVPSKIRLAMDYLLFF